MKNQGTIPPQDIWRKNRLQETWPHTHGWAAYWRTWRHSLHTHSLFKGIEAESALVIWIMPNGKHKLFFSTKTSLSGEEVLCTYRSRIQIEFCFRDAKQYTGLTHCQARHKNQLDFSYNASFASQNVAKVMMKENGMPYSMASFKEVMASTCIAKLIFDKCRRIPNRKLISHTVKELFGWAASSCLAVISNHT